MRRGRIAEEGIRLGGEESVCARSEIARGRRGTHRDKGRKSKKSSVQSKRKNQPARRVPDKTQDKCKAKADLVDDRLLAERTLVADAEPLVDAGAVEHVKARQHATLLAFSKVS